jgi:hypothetical protein
MSYANSLIHFQSWLLTLRSEYRLYRRHRAFSKAVVLFVLIRYVKGCATRVAAYPSSSYVSIAATVTSNIGFFGKGFTAHGCHQFHLVAPLLKGKTSFVWIHDLYGKLTHYILLQPVFATLISQIIISIRTYAISRQARWVLWTLSILFIVSCVVCIGLCYLRNIR